MTLTVPNQLTLLRLALIPVFFILFYLPFDWGHIAAAGVFVLAAFTDWLDGYLARRLDQTSSIGAFLDPVADKLMVATALVLVLKHDPGIALSAAVAVIIGREIAISALREWMAEIGARAQVAVSQIGKVKTATQMTAIALLIYRDPIFGMQTYLVGQVLLYLAVVLTLWSMTVYLVAAWPRLNDESGLSARMDDSA